MHCDQWQDYSQYLKVTFKYLQLGVGTLYETVAPTGNQAEIVWTWGSSCSEHRTFLLRGNVVTFSHHLLMSVSFNWATLSTLFLWCNIFCMSTRFFLHDKPSCVLRIGYSCYRVWVITNPQTHWSFILNLVKIPVFSLRFNVRVHFWEMSIKLLIRHP